MYLFKCFITPNFFQQIEQHLRYLRVYDPLRSEQEWIIDPKSANLDGWAITNTDKNQQLYFRDHGITSSVSKKKMLDKIVRM